MKLASQAKCFRCFTSSTSNQGCLSCRFPLLLLLLLLLLLGCAPKLGELEFMRRTPAQQCCSLCQLQSGLGMRLWLSYHVLPCSRAGRPARRFPLLMVAPEGTTKNLNVLLRFSTGAFVPGRPVLPVLLK